MIAGFPEKSSLSEIEQVSLVRQFDAVTLPQVHLCCRLCHTGVPIHCPSALLVGIGYDILRLPKNTPSASATYGPPTKLLTGGCKLELAVELDPNVSIGTGQNGHLQHNNFRMLD